MIETIKRFLYNKYLAFTVTLIIFVLCVMPSNKLPSAEDFNDKTAHFVAFAGWAFCWQFAFGNYTRTFLIGIIFGIAIEFIQGILPISFHRNFDWYDALADGIGVVIGLILYLARGIIGLKS